MNITLSADEKLIKRARNYARKHHTTLNNLVREYLVKIVNAKADDRAASEFEKNAITYAGRSDSNYNFKRDEIYNRK
jgi:hypothetical protein